MPKFIRQDPDRLRSPPLLHGIWAFLIHRRSFSSATLVLVHTHTETRRTGSFATGQGWGKNHQLRNCALYSPLISVILPPCPPSHPRSMSKQAFQIAHYVSGRAQRDAGGGGKPAGWAGTTRNHYPRLIVHRRRLCASPGHQQAALLLSSGCTAIGPRTVVPSGYRSPFP